MSTRIVPSLAPPSPPLPQLRKNGARLLALDGGGVKGVSSVLILHKIMERVKQIELEKGISTSQDLRKPVDYFDLAAGTSTGGLIAIMLFRLHMDTNQCLQAYHKLADKIFSPTFLGSALLGRLLGKVGLILNAFFKGAEFSGGPLEDAVKEIVNDYALPKEDKWKDYLVHPRSGMMFVCATLKDQGESVLLRTYRQPGDAKPVSDRARAISGDTENDNALNSIKIVQAARATSAAPVYLPEEKWETPAGPVTFWDGGVLNNNPVEQLWNARYDLVGVHDSPPAVSCVLSLGCSWSEHVKQPLLLRIFRTINRFTESFMANTEAKHRDFKRLVQRMNDRQTPNVHYLRLNAPTNFEHFDMADPKIMNRLQELTETYIATADVANKIEEIARLLASRD